MIGQRRCSTSARRSSTGRRRGSTSRACSSADAAGRRAFNPRDQDHGLDKVLDRKLIAQRAGARPRRAGADRTPIRNVDRTVGAMLSGEIARATAMPACRRHDRRSSFKGTAGPELRRLPGARRDARTEATPTTMSARACRAAASSSPPREAKRAIAGEHHRRQHRALRRDRRRMLFPRRRRRALRGAQFRRDRGGRGRGDHGCEYMTGGVVVVLGETGATSPPACRAASPMCSTRTATSPRAATWRWSSWSRLSARTSTRPAISKAPWPRRRHGRHDPLRRRAAAPTDRQRTRATPARPARARSWRTGKSIGRNSAR
jgi:hypothetical protein